MAIYRSTTLTYVPILDFSPMHSFKFAYLNIKKYDKIQRHRRPYKYSSVTVGRISRTWCSPASRCWCSRLVWYARHKIPKHEYDNFSVIYAGLIRFHWGTCLFLFCFPCDFNDIYWLLLILFWFFKITTCIYIKKETKSLEKTCSVYTVKQVNFEGNLISRAV